MYFLGNLAQTIPNIPSNLYWAKKWCILLEGRSQCTWISFTCSTELKSSSPFQNFRVNKTNVFSQSGPGGINNRYDYGQRSIVFFIFFLFTPSLTSSINLSYSLYQNKSLTTKIPHKFHRNCTKKNFRRTVFAMAVLQAPFWLPHWLTNSSFSYCVSYVTCHL